MVLILLLLILQYILELILFYIQIQFLNDYFLLDPTKHLYLLSSPIEFGHLILILLLNYS